jgi:hypothetical protein
MVSASLVTGGPNGVGAAAPVLPALPLPTPLLQALSVIADARTQIVSRT